MSNMEVDDVKVEEEEIAVSTPPLKPEKVDISVENLQDLEGGDGKNINPPQEQQEVLSIYTIHKGWTKGR